MNSHQAIMACVEAAHTALGYWPPLAWRFLIHPDFVVIASTTELAKQVLAFEQAGQVLP